MFTEESAEIGIPIQESTLMDPLDHTSGLDNYWNNHLGNSFVNEDDFNFNGTVDRFIDNKKTFNPEESLCLQIKIITTFWTMMMNQHY